MFGKMRQRFRKAGHKAQHWSQSHFESPTSTQSDCPNIYIRSMSANEAATTELWRYNHTSGLEDELPPKTCAYSPFVRAQQGNFS